MIHPKIDELFGEPNLLIPNRKPTGRVRLDTQGEPCTGYWQLNNNARNLALPRHHGTAQGNGAFGAGIAGQCFKTSTTGYISVPNSGELTIEGDFTVGCIFAKDGYQSSGGLVCKWSSANRYFVLWSGGTTNEVEFARYVATTFYPVALADSSYYDGTPTLVVARSVGNDIDIFAGKPGALPDYQAGGYNNSWSTGNNADELQIGAYDQADPAGSNLENAEFYNAFYLKGALSKADVEALYLDAYRWLKPEKSVGILTPSAGGGGGEALTPPVGSLASLGVGL